MFAPSLFGKSNVAKTLCRLYWRLERRRSIVLDPTLKDPRFHDWGPSALVFIDREQFIAAVNKHANCAVFFDEFGDYERDKANNPLFTKIRHQGHQLHIMSHAWTDCLRKQRNQLGKIFFFWQSELEAKLIAEELSDERLLAVSTLPKYEFLLCEKFKENPRHRITRGKFPPP
jgi:hypothetical protein